MDYDAHFQAFLASTVNLKQWKLDLLDNRVAAITNAFQADTVVGSMYKEHIPQGSWAHQTIINPVGALDEFDADILLHLEQDPNWNDQPKIYLQLAPSTGRTGVHVRGGPATGQRSSPSAGRGCARRTGRPRAQAGRASGGRRLRGHRKECRPAGRQGRPVS